MNLARINAVRRLNRVNRKLQRGQLDTPERLTAAIAEIDVAIAALDTLEETPLRIEDIASAHQLAGNLLSILGQHDAVLDRLADAEAMFERAGGSGEAYGRFLHDFAVTLLDLNARPAAIQYAGRAATVFAAAGRTRMAQDARAFHARLQSEYGDGPPPDLDALRAALRNASEVDRPLAAQAVAVTLLGREDRAEHVEEIHDAMHAALTGLAGGRRRNVDHLRSVLMLAIELYWEGLPVPSWLEGAAAAAVQEARAARRVDVESDVLTVLAVCRFHEGDPDAAIELALGATARHDEYSLSTETSLIRALTVHGSEYARQFALDAAIAAGDVALAAELLESARLQVEPVAADSDASRSLVGALHAISVGGRSRLAEHYSSSRPTLALEEMIAATGGEDTHWWGAWVANERVYWVLRLHGRWSAGRVVVAPGSRVSALIQEALEQSMLPMTSEAVDVLRGPWCRSSDDEEAFAAELGDHLVPPALQMALEDAARRDDPLSLVVSGNLFAYMPAAVLGVSGDDRVVRVVEGAVLRVAAPAIITARVASTPAPDSQLFPIVAACVDPDGSLRHSRAIPPGSGTVLGSVDEADAPASRDNVTAALQGRPGRPGLFYYSGHAAEQGMGSDAEDALVLAGGEQLSAGAVFAATGRDAAIAFPSRVLLSACSSSGAAGSGAGEWLGLSAALLWNGARQVLATSWSIWDTAFTAEFDLALARRLQRGDDPAASLRTTQLEALERWRGSGHDFTSFVDRGLSDAEFATPFPLVWAAYTCVGVRR
jgi:CHAT domain